MNFDTTNWRTEKIITLEQATHRAAELKSSGKKIVTVNGSFDVLHAGHLDQLEEAKKQGDILFVGINSDASVQEGKGPTRPFIPEQARAALLAALACVDYVVSIDKPYAEVPRVFIDAIQPHVHVNGPDYGLVETWIEWPTMQKYGTVGFSVKVRNPFSTTSLVEKIKGE